jgi:hypothetical protein
MVSIDVTALVADTPILIADTARDGPYQADHQ